VDGEQSVYKQSSLMEVVVVVTPCVISWREEWIVNEGRGRCDQLEKIWLTNLDMSECSVTRPVLLLMN